MVDFTITLTDTENKGMEYAANNVADWIDNAATNRARIAVDEMLLLVVGLKQPLNEIQTQQLN